MLGRVHERVCIEQGLGAHEPRLVSVRYNILTLAPLVTLVAAQLLRLNLTWLRYEARFGVDWSFGRAVQKPLTLLPKLALDVLVHPHLHLVHSCLHVVDRASQAPNRLTLRRML